MKERIADNGHVRLEDVTKKSFIPFLAGRPNRDTVISQEDILNLRIILNTSKSLDDLLSLV